MTQKALYTTTPAAREAGVSEATLRYWVRLGVLKSRKTSSGMNLFDLDEVLTVARVRAAKRKARRVSL